MKKFSLSKAFAYHAVMILIGLFFLFPLYYTVQNAFKVERLIIAYPPVWVFRPTLDHILKAIVEYRLYNYLANSLIISLLATILGLGIASFAAYALVRFRQQKLALFILVSTMVPYIICIIPLYVLFYNFGWLDTYHGLVLTHLIITVPQSVWILMAFIDGVPEELEEAAMIEGCGRAKAFLHIVFPLMRPGLVAAGILCFAVSWNDFKLALVLAGRHTTTAPLGLYNFLGTDIIDWGGLSAGATILIVPAIMFVFLIQKQLVRGLAIGGFGGI